MDFIRQHRLNINGPKNEISVSNEANEATFCLNTCTVTIPAQSEAIVDAHISNMVFSNKLALFESHDHSSQLVQFAKTVVEVDNSKDVKLLALNISDQPVTLERNQPLGKLCEVAEIYEMPKTRDYDPNSHTVPVEPELDAKLGENLDTEQRNRLRNLLSDYRTLFSQNDYDIGRTNLSRHRIDTGNADPVKSVPYRIPNRMKVEVNQKIQEMLEHDVIEPSFSP